MLIYLQMLETPEERTKFEILYLEYRDTMYYAAYDILGNSFDAEDAVHHAFVKIAEKIGRIEEAKSPKTRAYVVTAATNRAIDIYRAKQAHPSVSYADEVVGATVEYRGETPLAGCMLQLPLRQRQVLILKYHHGYALKEIAGMLGITYANALKIEQRAKANLKALCEEAGIQW